VVQLAGSEPSFSWLTFLLLLLPGVAVGMLLGWAYLRVNGMRQPRWLVFAPVLFASALLDPEIFAAFIRNGEGGGSLMVVATALAGGFVLSRTGFSAAPVASALVLLPGLLVLGFMGTMAAPMNSPAGALVCLYGLSLILLLCFASALPYPVVRGAPARGRSRCSAACAASPGRAGLRSFMSEVAGGGLRRTGGHPDWRLLCLSPLLFVAVLLSDPLDLPSLFDNGIGGGAIGVPAIGILGGYAACGRGSPRRRATAGLVFVTGLAVWALTATATWAATTSRSSHPTGCGRRFSTTRCWSPWRRPPPYRCGRRRSRDPVRHHYCRHLPHVRPRVHDRGQVNRSIVQRPHDGPHSHR
jgi:hypothetical protein